MPNLIVFAVNDLTSPRESLKEWALDKGVTCLNPEDWFEADIAEDKSNAVVLFYDSYWDSLDDVADFFDRTIGSLPILFLFDSAVPGLVQGEGALKQLLQQYGDKPSWWGAILSGKTKDDVEKTLGLNKLDKDLVRQHYVGSSQNWLKASKLLILKALDMLEKENPPNNWCLTLPDTLTDILSTTIHALYNAVIPIEADAATLDREANNVTNLVVQEIWEDHFGRGAFLLNESQVHTYDGNKGNISWFFGEWCKSIEGLLEDDHAKKIGKCLKQFQKKVEDANNKCTSVNSEKLRQNLLGIHAAGMNIIKSLRERRAKEAKNE